MIDSTATTGLPTDDARALAEIADRMQQTYEVTGDIWFQRAAAALRRTAPVAGRDRETVEAICRAVCAVEGIDPDGDTYGDGCDPCWTRYADAVAATQPAETPAELSKLREWKSAILGKCKASDGFDELKWAGDKEGWGFVHYFIGHLETRALHAETVLEEQDALKSETPAAIAGMREALTETTQQLELAHSLLPNGDARDQVWLTLLKAQRFLTTIPAPVPAGRVK